MAASLRLAVNRKCKQCIYDPLAGGTWRQQVQDCASPDCPLYEVRPKSRPKKLTLKHDIPVVSP